MGIGRARGRPTVYQRPHFRPAWTGAIPNKNNYLLGTFAVDSRPGGFAGYVKSGGGFFAADKAVASAYPQRGDPQGHAVRCIDVIRKPVARLQIVLPPKHIPAWLAALRAPETVESL